MRRISFSSQKSLEQLKDQLQSTNLSFEKIEQIEKNIATHLTEKTQDVAKKLLIIAEQKRDDLIKQQLNQIDSIHNLLNKMKKLNSLICFLSPKEIESKFQEIEIETSLLPEIDRKAARKELQHLRFKELCPILHDLDDTPHNFSYQVRKIAQTLQRTNSLAKLNQLNPRQLQEIFRDTNQSRLQVSPEGAAYAMDQYIGSLQRQAAIAEDFYYGHLGEGVDGLLQLPEDIRMRIEQLIEEISNGEAIDLTHPGYGELVAQAILLALEEQMGMCA